MKHVYELVERQLHSSTVFSARLGFGDPLFLQFVKAARTRSDLPDLRLYADQTENKIVAPFRKTVTTAPTGAAIRSWKMESVIDVAR